MVSSKLVGEIHKHGFGDIGMLTYKEVHWGICPMALSRAREQENNNYDRATLLTPDYIQKSQKKPPPIPTILIKSVRSLGKI